MHLSGFSFIVLQIMFIISGEHTSIKEVSMYSITFSTSMSRAFISIP